MALRIYGPDVTLIDAVDTGAQQPGALRGGLGRAFARPFGGSTNTAGLSAAPLALTPLSPSGGLADAFPSRLAQTPRNNLVVVDFDPVADPAALATFRARFGVETTTTSLSGAREGDPNAGTPPPLRFSRWIAHDQP